MLLPESVCVYIPSFRCVVPKVCFTKVTGAPIGHHKISEMMSFEVCPSFFFNSNFNLNVAIHHKRSCLIYILSKLNKFVIAGSRRLTPKMPIVCVVGEGGEEVCACFTIVHDLYA